MPRGAIGSTSDFDSEGSRFEPWRGIHSINISMKDINVRKKSQDIGYFVETLPDVDRLGYHPLGLALKNAAKNLYYVLIPKNASTSISASLTTSVLDRWTPDIIKELEHDARCIVVLRDPVDRFISALNMFLSTSRPLIDVYESTTANLRIIKDNQLSTSDCHFEEQHKFINFIPKDKIDFFYFNSNIIDDINRHYNLSFIHKPRFNVSARLVSSVNEETIKSIYAKDYELINSVNFINV